MEQPRRKPNRLQGYDYASPGGYFITICTKDKENVFWKNADGELSALGQIADQTVRQIPAHYPGVRLDHYTVMPNHIHLLLIVEQEGVSVSTVVNQMKGIVTKRFGRSVWQKLFYDHIIRNDAEYRKIWKYIDENPMKWELDCFYCE